MIVNKQQVRAILHGEDEIRYPYAPPTVGTIQAVQTRVGKRASCYVLIEDSWPHEDGGHMVRLKLHHQEAPPNYLRRGGGYTEDVSQAIKDPDAGGEEGLYAEELEGLLEANKRRARHERARRRKDQALLDMEARVVAYQREAAHRRIDIRNEVRVLRRALGKPQEADRRLEDVRKKLDRDLDRAA